MSGEKSFQSNKNPSIMSRVVEDFWLKNKHTINIFEAQVRDLAKHIEAQPKKHHAYKKKMCIQVSKIETKRA